MTEAIDRMVASYLERAATADSTLLKATTPKVVSPSDSRPLFGLGDSALMALLKRWTGAEYLSTGVARSERKKVEGNSLRPRTLSADVGARSKVVALTIAHGKK